MDTSQKTSSESKVAKLRGIAGIARDARETLCKSSEASGHRPKPPPAAHPPQLLAQLLPQKRDSVHALGGCAQVALLLTLARIDPDGDGELEVSVATALPAPLSSPSNLGSMDSSKDQHQRAAPAHGPGQRPR